MRTLYPVIVVISIAVGVMIIQMSGLPAVLMGGDQVSLIEADDELQKDVNESQINAKGSPESSSDGNFFQFVVGGVGRFIEFGKLVLILPATLDALPLIPWWFAYPVGVISEGIVVIGIGEALSQREWT